LGKTFNEGATAGGTGFIEHDIYNTAVLYFEALHILTANIQD
jgi:hypothetical protein